MKKKKKKKAFHAQYCNKQRKPGKKVLDNTAEN